MKKRKIVLFAAAAAGLIYSAAEGKGIFNRIRFKNVHEATARYVDSHYPNSYYSPITATEKGFITTVNRRGANNILLYITQSAGGVYIFHEENI